jgi:5-methylcytosine-specific restriction endonuclease McrA
MATTTMTISELNMYKQLLNLHDPSKRRARDKKWRKNNKEKICRQNKAHCEQYPDHIREQGRLRQMLWSRKNPDKYRAIIHRRDRDYCTAKTREWRKKNPEKARNSAHLRRVRIRASEGEDCSSKLKILMFERFCHWCCTRLTDSAKQHRPTDRTIDHVIPVSRGGQHVPDNLVAACKRCNCSKGTKLIGEWTWEMAA